MESKRYSWDFVTTDRVLNSGPCELLFAYLVPSGATTDSALYDGISTSGKRIATLKVSSVDGVAFSPPVPIYCDTGLYVDVGTSVTGILVMWRGL